MTHADEADVPPARPPSLGPGARIGRYLILERIGSGAMGVVYGAYDPELDRKIALKLLRNDDAGQDETARARLLREAKAMARLAHPNVVAVHDVGVFEGTVFLAMEFLGGGTLRSWLEARTRSVREILDAFVAAGRGLLAAHEAGLVHRDFKPENVLFDKDGRPRVVDFGLAREAGAATPAAAATPAGGDGDDHLVSAAAAADAALSSTTGSSSNRLDTLTRTGAVMGTPAYMAPEQFLGEATDERTDQFSFCVALYEALLGGRPFTGDTVMRLLLNVSEERFQERPELPERHEVPAWVRRAVGRGLKYDPAQRWPSMVPLIAALADDPAARQRRRVLVTAASVLLLAGAVAFAQVIHHRRQQIERRVAGALEQAARSSAAGRDRTAQLRDLRSRAFAAFDAPDRARGERLWKEALMVIPAADGAFDRARHAYETALVLDPENPDARAQLANLIYEQVLLARELRRPDRAHTLIELLVGYDDEGTRLAALEARGSLVVRTTPPAPAIALERYQRDAASGRRIATSVGSAGATAAPTSLAPGSYRLVVRAPGRAEVIEPFEVERGASVTIDLSLPRAEAVPPGYVYVPPGELWYGDADEQLRTGFLGAVPIHRRHTGAYLIARHEVTYGEWIAFLETLPPAERARHAPDVSTALRGSLLLRETDDHWQLTFEPSARRYTAREGQPLIYAGRQTRSQQDWTRLPVGGVSAVDARRYLGWLHASGGVPGARLCTEVEWERVARGADDRLFPHGDELEPDDANFDQTYGRVASALGPDEVGSHPISRSPFGVEDLAGNLFELVASSDRRGEIAIRGGAYYFSSYTCRATNREVVPPGVHDLTTGLRVCASLEESSHEIP